MVQRYFYDNVLGMNPEMPDYGPKGDWVKYEDYAALEADRDYWYEKCLDAGLLDEERAADRKEQDELLDEWYRTEECPYDKR